MKLYDRNPNFSIFLPGTCNANCAFCYNKEREVCKPLKLSEWLDNLTDTIHALPNEFNTVSITGYEPTLSRYLMPTLKLLKDYKYNFEKSIITTNGSGLDGYGRAKKYREAINENIDCINLSMHHFEELENRYIFGRDYNLSMDTIEWFFKFFHPGKITLQCVFGYQTETIEDFAEKYLEHAYNIGARAVCFRTPSGSTRLPKVALQHAKNEKYEQMWSELYQSISYSKNSMKILWKSTIKNPADLLALKGEGEIFELIYAPDGYTYSGWNFSEQELVTL